MAVQNLSRRRFIVRRNATAYRADERIAQFESIVGMVGVGLVGKAGAIESAHQGVARRITRKNAPGAIAAVRRGRETEDDHARVCVAKASDGSAPIGPITKGAAFLSGDSFAPERESGAAFA